MWWSYLLPSAVYQQKDETSLACLYQSRDSSELLELKNKPEIVNTFNTKPQQQFVGHGGSVVSSVPCVRMVAGSNPTLAATKGPWASPSLTVACSASAC